MKEREALKLALEAIYDLEGEINGYRTVDFPIPEKAKAAIKEALAQPEQDPVAFEAWYQNAIWGNEDFKAGCKRAWNAAIKTTTPPQRTWVGLTDEQIEEISRAIERNDFFDCVLPFARAIEAKLKRKNT